MTLREFGLEYVKKEMGDYYIELIELEFGMEVLDFIDEHFENVDGEYFITI